MVGRKEFNPLGTDEDNFSAMTENIGISLGKLEGFMKEISSTAIKLSYRDWLGKVEEYISKQKKAVKIK